MVWMKRNMLHSHMMNISNSPKSEQGLWAYKTVGSDNFGHMKSSSTG